MSTFNDLTYIIRQRGLKKFVVRLVSEINDDAVLTNAAAIAYAWMFALFPFFIFLLTLLPLLPDGVRAHVIELTGSFLRDQLTPDAANTILANVDQVMNQQRSGLLSFGLLLTLYFASGGMSTLMGALDVAYEVDRPRNFLTRRLIGIALTMFTAVCILIIAVVLPVGAAVKAWFDHAYPGRFNLPVTVLYVIVRYCIGLVALQLMLGVLYHYGTSHRTKLSFLSPGVLFAVFAWLLSGFAIRYYFSNYADYSKTYGTLAGVVVLLLVLYVNATVVLIGAEINSEVDLQSEEISSPYAGDDSASRPHP